MGGKGSGLRPLMCPHGILGKKKCPECQRDWNLKWRNGNMVRYSAIHVRQSTEYQRMHPKEHRVAVQRWKLNNTEKTKIHNLVTHHSGSYPLADECVFCGETENLEHAHLDYEDDGFNYVTSCHQCNCYMEVD